MSYAKEIERIYKMEGIKGFTRGYSAMMLRDGPGFGLYFCVFNFLKRQFGVSDSDRIDSNYHGMSQKEIGLRQFLSGGLAGCSTWTLAYPADSLKTQMQTVGFKHMSVISLLRYTVATHGFLHLYRGVHVQLLRAFPSTSTSMLVFETVKSKMRDS